MLCFILGLARVALCSQTTGDDDVYLEAHVKIEKYLASFPIAFHASDAKHLIWHGAVTTILLLCFALPGFAILLLELFGDFRENAKSIFGRIL